MFCLFEQSICILSCRFNCLSLVVFSFSLVFNVHLSHFTLCNQLSSSMPLKGAKGINNLWEGRKALKTTTTIVSLVNVHAVACCIVCKCNFYVKLFWTNVWNPCASSRNICHYLEQRQVLTCNHFGTLLDRKWGNWIAQAVEPLSRDLKVTGSNPWRANFVLSFSWCLWNHPFSGIRLTWSPKKHTTTTSWLAKKRRNTASPV